jgi:hypothetical protein
MEVLSSITQPIVDWVHEFDPREAPIVTDNPNLPYYVLPVYLAFVFLGPKVIKKEIPGLQTPLKYWNLFLCIFSAAMLVPWAFLVGRFAIQNGLYQALCMPNQEMWAKGSISAVICYIFMWSKFLELIDTAFLVLRARPVGGLHWYHHASVLFYCWVTMKSMVGFAMWFGIINSAIHTIMYYYYYSAAANGKPPAWGKYLTQMQMTQMVLGMVICGGWMYFWQTGSPAPLYGTIDARVIVGLTLVMYSSYFYLFLQMYLKKEAARKEGRRSERAPAGSSKAVKAE